MQSKRIVFVAVTSFVACASALEGQRVESVGLRARTDSSSGPRINQGPYRVLGSLGGSVVGFMAGGYVGYQVLPHDCGGCDDPGLDAIIHGALVGSIVGAALGASLADLHSVCSLDSRLARSLIGAGLAGGASYFLAGANGSDGVILAVPLGAIGGSLGALGKCWKSKP